MKKVCLLLCFLSFLTACSAASATELVDLQNDPLPVETPPEEEERVSYALNMVTWEDSVQAEDGTVLAAYSFQVPELTVRRGDGTTILDARTETEEQAAAVADAFNQRFEDWAAAGEFQQVSAEVMERWEMYQEDDTLPIWIGEYTLELTSSVYQTDRMVSVAGNYYSFTGGAHGNTVLLSWNFDLTAGTFFDVSMLAEDGPAFLTEVKTELIRQANTPQEDWGDTQDLHGYVPAMDYWENYEDVMANWSSYAVFFDETGMTVGFSPYELASYANGPQVFHIPYSWLQPYLSGHGQVVLGLEPAE